MKKTNPMFNIAMKAKHDTLSQLFNFIKNEIKIIEEKIGLDDIFISDVDNLQLSFRSDRALKLLNINYIGDLVTKSEGELLRIPNFGRLSLNEVKKALWALGLDLNMKHIVWPRQSVPLIPRQFDDNFIEINKQKHDPKVDLNTKLSMEQFINLSTPIKEEYRKYDRPDEVGNPRSTESE